MAADLDRHVAGRRDPLPVGVVDHPHRQPQHPSLDPVERVQITGVTVDGHRPIMPVLGRPVGPSRSAPHLDGYNSAMSSPTTDFDPDALRDKYRAERDKRLRADGNDQYLEVTGEFAHYVDDPYVDPLERAPLTDEVEVLIIGGGFGGLLAGARLREAGIDDIRIVEKGGDFGGTWYWNRYPGAQCDVESYIYLPLLEEIGYIPQGEVLAARRRSSSTARRSAGTSTCTRNACFQTEVTELRWDDSRRPLDRLDQPRRRDAGALRRAWRAGRCTGRSCRASPASRSSRVTRSTRAAGTTTTPAAITAAA